MIVHYQNHIFQQRSISNNVSDAILSLATSANGTSGTFWIRKVPRTAPSLTRWGRQDVRHSNEWCKRYFLSSLSSLEPLSHQFVVGLITGFGIFFSFYEPTAYLLPIKLELATTMNTHQLCYRLLSLKMLLCISFHHHYQHRLASLYEFCVSSLSNFIFCHYTIYHKKL